MKILLDTHALIWWFGNESKLSRRASSIIANQRNTVLVSAAIAWELAIKVNLGKFDTLSLATELPRYFRSAWSTQFGRDCCRCIIVTLLTACWWLRLKR